MSKSGISNRESDADEARERQEHPPLAGSPEPQDASGRTGEDPVESWHMDGHTAHKAGSRSVGQKEAGSRYPDRSMPATRKVDGAFGKEPPDIESPAEKDEP